MVEAGEGFEMVSQAHSLFVCMSALNGYNSSVMVDEEKDGGSWKRKNQLGYIMQR